MSNRFENRNENANVLKSKTRATKLALIISYLAIWIFAVTFFWFFTDGSDAMGYGIIFFWILLPVTTFILSILIGKNDYWGKLKWLSAAVFGVMYMLGEYATFSAANMKAFGNTNSPEWCMILYGGLLSAAGLGIGVLIKQIKQRKGR